MRLTFGNLRAKEEAARIGKEQMLFNRRVNGALRFLRLLPQLPPPGSPKNAYPETVDVYPLDVLEEASRQERERRAKEESR
jgi:hypothetical protein